MAASLDTVDMDLHNKEVVFMLVGEPGIGKSTLANAIIGTDVAPVSNPGEVLQRGHTKSVTKYTKIHEESGTTTIVYDTPGLGCEDPTLNEDEVVDIISRVLPEVHIVLFCVQLDQERFYPNNPTFTIIDKLRKTPQMNKDLWEKAIIILARANMAFVSISAREMDPKKSLSIFDKRIKAFSDIIREKLSAPDIASPSILPAGLGGQCISAMHKDSWLSRIWETCFDLIHHDDKDAALSLFMINISRIKLESDGSWHDKRGYIQLSREFTSRHGIAIAGTAGTGVLGAVLLAVGISNPITASTIAVGGLITLVVAGVSYKWRKKAPNEDFMIKVEEIKGSGDTSQDERDGLPACNTSGGNVDEEESNFDDAESQVVKDD